MGLNFKYLANEHQKKYKAKLLETNICKDCILSDKDARKGFNFYTDFRGLFEIVNARYKYEYNKEMYENMLRSEHIPFNFFSPLKLSIENSDTKKFIEKLIPGIVIEKINFIEIEYAPPEKGKYLDDRTSFDAYINYKYSENEITKIGAIGIEVKYTEKSYPYGKTEKERMFDEKSKYHVTTHLSGIYEENSIEHLRKVELKQIWRNHLLGLKMKLNGSIQKFHSVHLYPGFNDYQHNKALIYLNHIRAEYKNEFISLTYEDFISKGREIYSNNQIMLKWLDYLDKRYIFDNDK